MSSKLARSMSEGWASTALNDFRTWLLTAV
jgi:hypothetical protein